MAVSSFVRNGLPFREHFLYVTRVKREAGNAVKAFEILVGYSDIGNLKSAAVFAAGLHYVNGFVCGNSYGYICLENRAADCCAVAVCSCGHIYTHERRACRVDSLSKNAQRLIERA